jgi:hypothetical protein
VPQPKDWSSLSSNEFERGATAGQGALTEVKQTLSSNIFAPAVLWFLMSTPLLAVWSTDSCTGGLPVMRFRRTRFL